MPSLPDRRQQVLHHGAVAQPDFRIGLHAGSEPKALPIHFQAHLLERNQRLVDQGLILLAWISLGIAIAGVVGGDSACVRNDEFTSLGEIGCLEPVGFYQSPVLYVLQPVNRNRKLVDVGTGRNIRNARHQCIFNLGCHDQLASLNRVSQGQYRAEIFSLSQIFKHISRDGCFSNQPIPIHPPCPS